MTSYHVMQCVVQYLHIGNRCPYIMGHGLMNVDCCNINAVYSIYNLSMLIDEKYCINF